MPVADRTQLNQYSDVLARICTAQVCSVLYCPLRVHAVQNAVWPRPMQPRCTCRLPSN